MMLSCTSLDAEGDSPLSRELYDSEYLNLTVRKPSIPISCNISSYFLKWILMIERFFIV